MKLSSVARHATSTVTARPTKSTSASPTRPIARPVDGFEPAATTLRYQINQSRPKPVIIRPGEE